MNELITTNTHTVKMTSLDIAEMTGKQHAHVMRDIRQEIERIGETNRSIFGLVDYTDAKGEKRACYQFGKTGAMQIALRYDAKTRYKVVKKLEELEAGIASQTPIAPMVFEELEAFGKIAEFFGATGNQAKLSANTAIKKLHGIDCMATLGLTGIIAEDKVQYFTPTVIGKQVGLSAVKMNKALEKAGMQTATRDHKKRIVWVVTENGKAYCQLLDTAKKHSDGTPIMQIKWAESVLKLVGVV